MTFQQFFLFGWALLGADLWVALAAGLRLRDMLKCDGKA